MGQRAMDPGDHSCRILTKGSLQVWVHPPGPGLCLSWGAYRWDGRGDAQVAPYFGGAGRMVW